LRSRRAIAVPITGSSEPEGAVHEEKLKIEREPQHLRVLIANERAERLERVAVVVVSLGHTVIARELNVDEVGQVTREERPDVALVGLGESSEHALEHISQIVHEAACPVIALLGSDDPAFISEAARRGVFGYITDGDGSHLQGAIDIALGRFAEYHNLEGAFGRRAVIERAKGILMERHGANDKVAFEMLRDHSQTTGRKLFDIAQAILDSHQLLSPTRFETPTGGLRAS
jgi:AmiR/NasT family two-component response regulator